MQYNVFYYRLMTHPLEDGKKEGAKVQMKLTSFRNSHSHMFFKIGVLKSFTIFTGNTCAEVSF